MSQPVGFLDFLFKYIAFTSARDNYLAAVQDWKSINDLLNSNGAGDDRDTIKGFADLTSIQNLSSELDGEEASAINAYATFFNNNPPQ
jgi:hypothetical protein